MIPIQEIITLFRMMKEIITTIPIIVIHIITVHPTIIIIFYTPFSHSHHLVVIIVDMVAFMADIIMVDTVAIMVDMVAFMVDTVDLVVGTAAITNYVLYIEALLHDVIIVL